MTPTPPDNRGQPVAGPVRGLWRRVGRSCGFRGCLASSIGLVALIVSVEILPAGLDQSAIPMLVLIIVAFIVFSVLPGQQSLRHRLAVPPPVQQRVKRQSLPPSVRFKLLQRDAYRCQLCGRTASQGAQLEVDHRIPVAKGGTNDPSNLWTLCWDCNRGKSDRDL